MTIGIVALDHVNVVVPKELEDVTKHFYGSLLGLHEIPKPLELRANGGAWYQLGAVQLHLSVRDDEGLNKKGHVCFTVADVASAEERVVASGVEVIPDDQPIAGQPRFYVRDPGRNLIEIAQHTIQARGSAA